MKQKVCYSFVILMLAGALVSCKADVPPSDAAPTNVMQIGQAPSDSAVKSLMDPSVERISVTKDAAKAGKTATLTFAGKEYLLEYKETCRYIIGDVTVDRYRILNSAAGNDRAWVELLPDGKLFAIKGEPIYQLSIGKDWTAEQVRPVLEARLKNEFDFTRYSGFRWSGTPEATPDSFKIYDFCWYREKNGFMLGDYLQISVWEDGTVPAFSQWENAGKSYAPVSDTVCVEDYLPEIEKTLTALYADYDLTLKSFEVRTPAAIRLYQGEYHIECTAVSQVLSTAGGRIEEATMDEILLIRIA